MHELAYDYLKKAQGCSLEKVQEKYILFVMSTAYGLYVNDWLSVACYWTNKIDEGRALIKGVIDNPTFKESKEHFNNNLEHFDNLEEKLKNA
jgi:hypothetical protein